MAEPSIFPEGSAPRSGDTRWRTIVKIVGQAYENATVKNPANIPTPSDPIWKLYEKWDRIKTGV